MNRSKKAEVILVAAILGVISLMTMPKFTQATTEQRLDMLCRNLQLVRSGLAKYHLQHNQKWPKQATFVEQMTGKTNLAGTTNAADGELILGPYLDEVPCNPFTGGNRVDGRDWFYDELTGLFRAADSGQTNGIFHRNL